MSVLDGKILSPGRSRELGRGARTVSNKRRVGADPVNKVSEQNRVNRTAKRSTLQHMILSVLHDAGQPEAGRIGHLPRTGDIIDALGLPRTKSTFASVSRSLARLEASDWIVSYETEINTRGKGRHYGVKR